MTRETAAGQGGQSSRLPQSSHITFVSVISKPIQNSGKKKTSNKAKTIQPPWEISVVVRGRAVLPQ